jgi:carboxyl-terminal processing protease
MVSMVASLLFCSSPLLVDAGVEHRRELLRGIITIFETNHLSGNRLDDAVASRWLAKFVDRIDPKRLYFHAADIDEFRRFEKRLDDDAKRGDLSFAELVRKRYRQRTAEAAKIASDVLTAEQDFSIDEQCPLEFEGFATSREALQARWRLRLKLELLIEKMHGRSRDEVISQLTARYDRIASDAAHLSDERLTGMYLDSLAQVYDGRTRYLSAEWWERLNQNITIKRFRLGIYYRRRGGEFVITAVEPSLSIARSPERIIGWSVVGIRRVNGTTIDLVEMHPDDFEGLVGSTKEALKSDERVILELRHPVTLERATLDWPRYLR